MARKTGKAALSPAVIMEDLTGAWRSRTLAAAVELDVFSHIAKGKRTAKDVAGAAGASPRGMAHLLDALTGIGYLHMTGGHYGLRPVSATFLVRGKTAYMGAMAQAMSLTWDAWKDLTEVVKSGRSAEAVNVAEKGKEFFPKLVASIFPGNFAASKAAVSNLPEKERRQIHRILDVGAGSGAWSLAFAQAIPQARVTTVDFPEMTAITRATCGWWISDTMPMTWCSSATSSTRKEKRMARSFYASPTRRCGAAGSCSSRNMSRTTPARDLRCRCCLA